MSRNPRRAIDCSAGGAVSLATATIRELSDALDAGAVTSVELVVMYLNRIGFYDRSTIALNAVALINAAVFAEARQADRLRREGTQLGPLHGIPFVVKDSFAVGGMTLAAGSPAFQDLVASEDAGAVSMLREGGAIILGKTTMPPMAAGGMQRGVYGRPKSPYNPAYLPAGWLSGSSSGTAVAVAAGLCAFGLGEETLSSGRSPASNNGLVAYVPSRGLISLRGNWPLMSLRDQVAPFARTVEDLLYVLDALVHDDTRDSCSALDLWRDQDVVPLPSPSTVRPDSFLDLRDPAALSGLTVGVPRLFVGKNTSVTEPVLLESSVQRLWSRAEEDLRALGATVVEVDPPAFHRFADLMEATTLAKLDYWPKDFPAREWVRLIASTWDTFLKHNADPALPSLSALGDFSSIYPEEFRGLGSEVNPMRGYDYPAIANEAAAGIVPIWEINGLSQAMVGLERFREDHLDDWLTAQGIDLLAFPAHAGVGPADADREPAAALQAWRPGVNYALGGTAMRALGIPGVVVPMGCMADTGMPVGITFAGRAYSDCTLLAAAYAYERATKHRSDPVYVPVGPHDRLHYRHPGHLPQTGDHAARETDDDLTANDLRIEVIRYDGKTLRLAVEIVAGDPVRSLSLTVDGIRVHGVRAVVGRQELEVDRTSLGPRTTADGPQSGLIVVLALFTNGIRLGAFGEFDRPQRYDAARR